VAAARTPRLLVAIAVVAVALGTCVVAQAYSSARDRSLDGRLAHALMTAGFSGRIESTLPARLGRPVDPRLADVGRLLWFDTATGLNGDNACAGCHSPTAGFGDTQSIAIGIENNSVVGPDRAGPRNMRRAPTVINTAFFPTLMWNSRFTSLSDDPFDNSAGFLFPDPEGMTLSYLPHLLDAQAFIPPTERTEVAGFAFPGDNHAIRAEMLRRLNAIPAYRTLFGRIFPEVRHGAPITVDMFATAIAEFEFALTFANAPIDRYARGDLDALTDQEKQGALLFFGQAGCVACHAVSGSSNEMFSDFREHVIGVPQIVPRLTNNIFDGPDANQDFGREDLTGNPADRYAFRTAPLRNVALAPAFMHDGAFLKLERAIAHHLDVFTSTDSYDPAAEGLAPDLAGPPGPVEPVLARLDPLVATPKRLRADQLDELVAFLSNGLLDPRARPEKLKRLVPKQVPSGRPVMTFEFPETTSTWTAPRH
jgi:cytochrome c peroxidase